jgi:RNA polymerase sigma-70 factor (ECF subfamily)
LGSTAKRPFEELCAGDSPACEQFVREHYEELYRWLYRLTGCGHRAQDLTQESFAAFWESLKRTVPQVSARTWLFSIARNQWRKHRRTRTRREQEEEHPDRVVAKQPSPSAALEEREFADALRSALAELSPVLREVFSLRVWEELDYAQIAAVQGIGPDLARWRFFRARTLIRDRLKGWRWAEEKCHGE